MRSFLPLIALCWLTAAGPTWAQSSVPPDQIEEDWQIVLATPDPTGGGPQMSTLMTPVEDGTEPSFVLDLNYRTEPSFSPGGLQAQVWNDDVLISSTSKGTAQCSTPGETITWTQRMRLSSGSINFAIDSGHSTTWGRFGQGQQLNVGASFPTALTSLSRYSPALSVSASGVGWQPNRVASMTLLRVRYYAGGKLLWTDNTPRSVNLSN